MKITITDKAREMILSIREQEGRPEDTLRVTARRGGPNGVMFGLAFAGEAEITEDDTTVEIDGIRVCADGMSVPLLEEATVDYVEGEWESGFKIDAAPPPELRGPIAEKVQKVLNDRVNPSIAGHGGFVSLVDVKDKAVYLQFGGGCQGCGMANVTLKDGVEVMIREDVPEVEEIYDITDHSSGQSPYYK